MELLLIAPGLGLVILGVAYGYLTLVHRCVCGHSELEHCGDVSLGNGRTLSGVCLGGDAFECACGRYREL